MTHLKKILVQRALPGYLAAKGIKIDALAYKLKVGTLVLNEMMHGQWNNIESGIWQKVWNELSPDKLQGLFQTEDFKSVWDLCTKAINNKWMIGLTGNTGMGKTTALEAYGLRPNVFYYYIDKTVSPRSFFEDLLMDLGFEYSGSLNGLLNRIVCELNTLKEPLLIIDECGKLNNKMLLALHSLRDQTRINCGIVLAGMPDFKNNLIKQVNKGTMGYAEFFRRINIWHTLNGLSSEEIKLVLETNGITDKDVQREFRKLDRFGDLINEITLYKSINN